MELLPTADVVALKVAEIAAAATVTDAGTFKIELLFARVTLAPPAGAGWVRVTVQVLEDFAARLLGLQDRVDSDAGAIKVKVLVAELPL